jgi:hypothetical protein
MNEVTKLAIKFVSENWDKIDRNRIETIHTSKESFIKNIEKDYYTACWVVTEVMSWGAGKDYIKEYQVDNEEEIFVVKLNSKYFKTNFETYCLDECEPKYKTVMYF